jgi:hypothetical protein
MSHPRREDRLEIWTDKREGLSATTTLRSEILFLIYE